VIGTEIQILDVLRQLASHYLPVDSSNALAANSPLLTEIILPAVPPSIALTFEFEGGCISGFFSRCLHDVRSG
jgi:hypothetical protein